MLNLPPSAFPPSLRALLVPPPSSTEPDGRERASRRRRRRGLHVLRLRAPRVSAAHESSKVREQSEVLEARD